VTELQLSGCDTGAVIEVERLAAAGHVESLMPLLSDPSWAVRRSVVGALARIGQPAVAPLVDVLRSHRDHEARLAATADALSSSRGDVETALVALAAEDPVAPVLCDVAQIFGRRRSAGAVPWLAKAVAHSDDNVSVGSIEALGHIGGPGGVDALVEVVRGGNFFRTFPAIEVLGRSGDLRALESLIGLLRQPIYAVEAARALGRIGDERAIEPLVELLTRSSHALVRVAAQGLCEIRKSRQLALTLPSLEGVGRRLAECLPGANTDEQQAICEVLGWLEAEEAIPALIDLLEAPGQVGPAALHALQTFGRQVDAPLMNYLDSSGSELRLLLLPMIGGRGSGLAPIYACLDDPEPSVRSAACATLGRIGDPAAVENLFGRLGDRDQGVVLAAVSAIQSLGSPLTEQLALVAARSADAAIRRAAMRVVSYFGYASGIEVMLLGMADPDERLRDVAIAGLAYIEDGRAVAALLGAADHASPKTRASVMRALGHLPLAVVGEPLRRGLGDADGWVRYYACQALGKLRDTTAVPTIVALIDDPAGQVRVAAVDALASLQTDESFAALREAARSADLDMQRAALLGLGAAKRPEALPALLDGLRSADATTRLVALAGVAELDHAEVIPALLRAATDPAEALRKGAVAYLAGRPGEEASRALAGLVADRTLRAVALEALALPQPGRVAAVIGALDTASSEVATLLVGVLARMKRADAIVSLLTSHPVAAVRNAAAQVLASTNSPDARRALERAAADDPDPAVRRMCSLSLGQ